MLLFYVWLFGFEAEGSSVPHQGLNPHLLPEGKALTTRLREVPIGPFKGLPAFYQSGQRERREQAFVNITHALVQGHCHKMPQSAWFKQQEFIAPQSG